MAIFFISPLDISPLLASSSGASGKVTATFEYRTGSDVLSGTSNEHPARLMLTGSRLEIAPADVNDFAVTYPRST